MEDRDRERNLYFYDLITINQSSLYYNMKKIELCLSYSPKSEVNVDFFYSSSSSIFFSLYDSRIGHISFGFQHWILIVVHLEHDQNHRYFSYTLNTYYNIQKSC